MAPKPHKTTKLSQATREKRISKRLFRFVFISGVLWYLYYAFFEYATIGSDKRQYIVVYILPAIIGVSGLAYYRRQFLKEEWRLSKGIPTKIFIGLFYLIMAIMASFVTVGFVAQATWNYVNHRVAESTSTRTIICDVDKFSWYRTNRDVEFHYNGHFEKLPLSHDEIKRFVNENPDQYELHIVIRDGVWNHAFVESFSLVKKSE